MTVKELMAAFKTSRRSLSTRPLARHREAAKNDPRTTAARAGLAEQGVSTHVGSDGGVYTDSVEQPPAPLAHRTVTDSESHAAIERLTKPARTRKPTPCKCECNTGESARHECENLNPCGHKGCGLAAE